MTTKTKELVRAFKKYLKDLGPWKLNDITYGNRRRELQEQLIRVFKDIGYEKAVVVGDCFGRYFAFPVVLMGKTISGKVLYIRVADGLNDKIESIDQTFVDYNTFKLKIEGPMKSLEKQQKAFDKLLKDNLLEV